MKNLENILKNLLEKNHLTIAFAESCTGGLCAATLINVSGASNVINESIVTYSNESKIKYLGVNASTIEAFGIVSLEISDEMAIGIKNASLASIGVGITGFTGAEGDMHTEGKTVCYSILFDEKITHSVLKYTTEDRNQIRYLVVEEIFKKIIAIIEEVYNE